MVAIVSKFEFPSLNGLGLVMFWRFGTHGLTNDGAVCRTTLATPGLLIRKKTTQENMKIQ